ncbi:MAG: HEAT repeat domain-containing protein [Gemmataceae bacterium]|nr:HEAT repeat domain-containing protein [Gemmataceae bacterium]
MSDLLTEVGRFRAWADAEYAVPPDQRGGEWECDYGSWTDLRAAVLAFVAARPFDSWSAEELRAVLYAIARDNEIEYLARQVRSRHPDTFVALAAAAIGGDEPNARWQLAEGLGQLRRAGGEEERLLLALARDGHEYVRRRALGALARLGSPAAEGLALAAWDRPDENQEWARMMALWALHRIESPHLSRLLDEAERDPRQYLPGYAARVRRGEVDP